ncbi:MAG TPA: nucleotidyltransferase family protein [Thermoleophilaceae bacterium]|nr:nucleotidyltransferase family protein [Thermoleophilaceae bacterium]
MIAALVLAAGAGTRFGGRKQLAELDGRPLLEHALAAVAQAPVDETVVVLGAAAEEVMEHVDLHGARPVVCDRWEEGLSASLAAGLAALEGAEAVVVCLGDQPRLSVEAISRVIEARDGAPATRATYDGEPGHPVVLEAELLGPLRHVTGDRGARSLLRRVGARLVPCDDLGGGEDVDTADELGKLRRAL